MTKILFVCHGNICRSPMAEFVMKHLVKKHGVEKEFIIESAATTREEIGADIHPGTQQELRLRGIPFEHRNARQFMPVEYEQWDYIVAMDYENLHHLRHYTGGDQNNKINLLLSFAGQDRGVADPWYTGNFGVTFDDVLWGCTALLDKIIGKHNSQKLN